MPYTDVSATPEHVQRLPAAKQRQWMHVFNSAYSACMNGDEFSTSSKCESAAFAQANGTVKATEGPVNFDELEQPTFQMSVEALAFAAPGAVDFTQPQWIPFLPKPGKYTHPKYGQVELTSDLNTDLVNSVKQRVYQEHIPLDAEHQTKLSGAVGWLKDMRLNEDGSGDALVEMTARGQGLLASGGFRYVSPEWYPTWPEPGGQVHKNVVVGGAITTRPFFKERHGLRALVASESGVELTGEDPISMAEMKDCPGCNKKIAATAKSCDCGYKFMEDKVTDPNPPQTLTMTEVDARIASALEAQTKQFTEQIEAEKAARTAAETLAASEREAREGLQTTVASLLESQRTAKFTEMIAGKGGQDDGAAWVGDPEKHRSLLTTLANQFGEDSEAVTEYVELQRSIAQQAKEANLFSEVGKGGASSGPSGSTAADKLDSLIKKAMADENISFAAAEVKVHESDEGRQLFNEAMASGQ